MYTIDVTLGSEWFLGCSDGSVCRCRCDDSQFQFFSDAERAARAVRQRYPDAKQIVVIEPRY